MSMKEYIVDACIKSLLIIFFTPFTTIFWHLLESFFDM
jgi:hypothetical protein